MGDIVKACYSTSDRKDALRIFEAALELKSTGHKYCLMGLGPGGDWARIHAPVLGQGLVYATTESGWHLAQQGRINASDLENGLGSYGVFLIRGIIIQERDLNHPRLFLSQCS